MNFKKTAAIVAAAGALAALAVPAMAETTLYGSARTATFWTTNQPGYAAGAVKPDNNTDFDLRNQTNSRFGAKFANGDVTGQIELGLGLSGLGTAVGGGNTAVYTRLIYGTSKFDFGTLLVGQTYTPYWFASDQVALDDQGNNGYGSIYDGRQPQLKLTLNNGVYVALIRPGTPAAAPATSETFFPKVAAGYEGKAGIFAYGAGVAAQMYTDRAAAGQDESVTSVLGYFHGKLPAGPANIGFNLGVGQNLGNMGIAEGLSAAYNATGKKMENNLTVSALVTAGFIVSPTVKVNVGLGYVTTDGKTAAGVDFKKADNKLSAYVSAPIILAKGFSVTPEFTYQDQLDESTGAKGAKDYIYGAKWQFDF